MHFKSGKSEFYSRPADEDFLRKTVKELFTQYKVQDPPEGRTGQCDEYNQKDFKWGQNYICAGWGNDVYSLECVCLDYDGKDQFVDKEKDN